MSDELRSYEAALGVGALGPCDVVLDELRLECCVEPADGVALARAVAALAQHDLRAVVRGAGTLDHFGNTPEPAEVLISTARLRGVEELAADEGVVYVRAGTKIAELQEAAAAEGWFVPLDPPGEATVGGTLAAGQVGPLCLGFGMPRDAVLGLDVVLPSGERTRCGGRVVKNVTGYDLGKLYTGSFGSLGVIEAAWLRMRPLPERRETAILALGEGAESSAARALEVARRTSVACAALLSPAAAAALGVDGPGEWSLLVALAGADAEVGADLSALGGHVNVPGEALDRLRALQLPASAEVGLRARMAFEPSRSAATLDLLRRSAADVVAHVGAGLLYACWDEEAAGPGAEHALRAVAEVAAADGVEVRLEALPTAAKRGRDVFGAAEGALPLMRALKTRFDPEGRLNPGRFAGHL